MRGTERDELRAAPEATLHAQLRRWFRWRVNDAADAEDLTQEAFLRIYAADTDKVVDRGAYLRRTAVNLDIEHRRRAARRRERGDPVELNEEIHAASEELSPERILIGKDEMRRMMSLLEELPERSRTIFVLSRFEGMTGVQIAKHVGISTSAVEKHMMRTMAHLRSGMGRR